jgi:CRP/FNR family transcriptional regulator, cyclic AMP receptor protein
MANQELSGLLLIEKVLLLKSLSIFSDTPETILAEMAHLLKEVEYAEGAAIMKEGETGNCMYIIFRGEVKITKGNEMLAVLKEKDFFGELSLMDTETRSATATAATDCILFRLDQEPFYDLMESRPEVVRGVIQILCKRLRMANQRIFDLTRNNNR